MSHPIADLRGAARVGPGTRHPALDRAASWAYGLGARTYHALYDLHLRRSRRVRAPVVSVGALTVGGAGKTPFARWLAAALRARGHRPAILSRGYGSSGGAEPRLVDPGAADPARDGDEPVLLARSLRDVPVVVCPDRARAAGLAIGRGADVMILDDGFQHRRLHRDVDVVLWDRTSAEARGRLVPAGPLREPSGAVRRAGVVVLVDRGDGGPPPPASLPRSTRVFTARLVVRARQDLEPGRAVHVLSGIADPGSFERAVEELGFPVTGATRHADHHAFRPSEILAAVRRAEREGADFLAVTAKDHVRWPRGAADLPRPAVFDLDVEMDSADSFLETLEARWRQART